jgi:ribosome-associated translation inhibitor RaiA
MERNVEFKAFEPAPQTRKLIDRMTSRLEKQASTFSPELAHLRLFIERIAAHRLYNISITLDLQGKTLAAKHEQHALKPGLRSAFEEIERQLKKYKEGTRGEHWKRPARRQELREIKTQAASSIEDEAA